MLQLVFWKNIQNRWFLFLNVLYQPLLQPPLIEMHWLSMDGVGIPKVCTDCGYFCQLLTLAITKSDWCGNERSIAGFMGKGFPGWKLLRYHVDIDQCHWWWRLPSKNTVKIVKTDSVASNCQSGLNVDHVFVVSWLLIYAIFIRRGLSHLTHMYSQMDYNCWFRRFSLVIVINAYYIESTKEPMCDF